MASVVNYVSYIHAPGGSKDIELNYSITVSGTYTTAATGETINLTTALNPNGLELAGQLPIATLDEKFVDIMSCNAGGYTCTTSAYSAGLFNLFFFTGIAELGTGTYPAVISGGQVNIRVRHRI
jgi:hypothetical protein